MGSISEDDDKLDTGPLTPDPVINGEEQDVVQGEANGAAAAPEPRSRWQCERVNLLDRSLFILENNDALSDVMFVVGKGVLQREIPAHR